MEPTCTPPASYNSYMQQFRDPDGNYYSMDPYGILYDSANQICYLDSIGRIYYIDNDGTLYNFAGQICYMDEYQRITPFSLEHNGQTYYQDPSGYFYTLQEDGQVSYTQNAAPKTITINPDCLRTKRAEGALPPYLSDHSIIISRVRIPGRDTQDFPSEINYATWNVLERCQRLSRKGAKKKTNNPFKMTDEPEYYVRLNETIDKIISIIDQHESLGAFFLQEAYGLSFNEIFPKILQKRNWSFVRKPRGNLIILFNQNILKHIDTPLNNAFSDDNEDYFKREFNWKTSLNDRFLLRHFCLLSENEPVCQIALCNFHLEKGNNRNKKKLKQLFEHIAKKTGTIVFSGDTNEKKLTSLGIFLGDPSKKTTTPSEANKTTPRKVFSAVSSPIPGIPDIPGIEFEELTVVYFKKMYSGFVQLVADFSLNPNTLTLEPSETFIKRPKKNIYSTPSDPFNKASKDLFKKIEASLFETKGKHFYINPPLSMDTVNLKSILDNSELDSKTINLYKEKELVVIYLYDITQVRIFTNQKEFIDNNLISIQSITERNQTLTRLYYPFEIFEKFCERLEIPETLSSEFSRLLKEEIKKIDS